MVVEVHEYNVPNVYPELMRRMRLEGEDEGSRNGPVLALQDPLHLTIIDPLERVIFDPIRDANPFFHVMEFIWMMAGSNNVNWIEKFNSKYRQYADGDIVHGAYGYRWIQHFGYVNQITGVCNLLKKDRTSRRAVLGMWDPQYDLQHHNDLPCNTHIYFRVDREDKLNMTVCNRSNDVIWGMLGANAVHMTYLQELIAHGAGIDIGMYHVFSHNAHIYKGLPKYSEILNTTAAVDHYINPEAGCRPMPLLLKLETVGMFLEDCHKFITGQTNFQCEWMYRVALPMYNSWMARKDKINDGMEDAMNIAASDWRYACVEWIKRR